MSRPVCHSFIIFCLFFSVLFVLSVLVLACWLIWWMPLNNVRLLFIRWILVYMYIFATVFFSLGSMWLFSVSFCRQFTFICLPISNAYLIPFHSFLSFVRSVFLFLAVLDLLTVINTQEGISLQKVNQIAIISRKHSKPLKWIECDHWLLYWIYFTLNVFTENLSTSHRFVLLCCFGSVKPSRTTTICLH